MKKFLTLLLALTFVVSLAGLTVSAKETSVTLEIPKVETPPTIDGKVDDLWKFAPEVDVVNFGSNIFPQTSSPKGDEETPVAKAKARMMWDETTLYCLVRVFDPSVNAPWTEVGMEDCDWDGIDFQISESNAEAEPMRDDTVGDGNKYPGNGIFNVNFQGKLTGWGGVWFADNGKDKAKCGATYEDVPYGYIVEIAIPLQTMVTKEGQEIGFEIQINDNQDGSKRTAIRQWACETCMGHSNTKYLGTLLCGKASTTEYEFVDFEYTVETAAPETLAPETKAPETKAPETKAPETKAPETKAPETNAPETKAPEKKAGCGSIVAAAALVPMLLAAAYVCGKKH